MTSKHQAIWLRAVRKYQKLVETHGRVSSTNENKTYNRTSLWNKLNILRRRLLRMNRAWKLGIATASLIAWLNAPAVAQFPAVVELSNLDGSNGFTINGISPPHALGTSVSSLGDVNGDNIDDIIVGSPYANTNFIGECYVIFGNSTGFTNTFNPTTLDGNNGFVIKSGSVRLGRAVSSVGDVNGD